MQENKKTLRIVIADNESLIRLDIREMLEEAGHEVVGEAINGRRAVELTRQHHPDLVLMDILQAKRIVIAFLGVKTHRNALNRSDVIHRTLLVKISQCDMPVLFINFDGRDRRRHLLYQCQAFLQVLLVGSVDEVLQGGAPKASGIPGCHSIIRLRFLFIVYIPQLSFLMFYQYA